MKQKMEGNPSNNNNAHLALNTLNSALERNVGSQVKKDAEEEATGCGGAGLEPGADGAVAEAVAVGLPEAATRARVWLCVSVL